MDHTVSYVAYFTLMSCVLFFCLMSYVCAADTPPADRQVGSEQIPRQDLRRWWIWSSELPYILNHCQNGFGMVVAWGCLLCTELRESARKLHSLLKVIGSYWRMCHLDSYWKTCHVDSYWKTCHVNLCWKMCHVDFCWKTCHVDSCWKMCHIDSCWKTARFSVILRWPCAVEITVQELTNLQIFRMLW